MYKLSVKKHNKRMKLYKMGMNDNEIGEKVFRNALTIFKWRKTNNLKAVPKKAWNKGTKSLYQAWNKGLTKETDIRIKKYAKALTNRKFSKHVRKKISKSLLGKYTGKNNWNYKGGRKYGNTLKWDKIRKIILKRDKHKCRNCGSRKNLHVHHMIPDRIRSHPEYMCLPTSFVFDKPVWFVTLCISCHSSVGKMMDKMIYSIRKENRKKLRGKN